MALILTPGQFSRRGEFYFKLGQLTTAGVGLIKAIDFAVESPPSTSYRRPLRQLQASLAEGDTFSGALARLGSWTPA